MVHSLQQLGVTGGGDDRYFGIAVKGRPIEELHTAEAIEPLPESFLELGSVGDVFGDLGDGLANVVLVEEFRDRIGQGRRKDVIKTLVMVGDVLNGLDERLEFNEAGEVVSPLFGSIENVANRFTGAEGHAMRIPGRRIDCRGVELSDVGDRHELLKEIEIFASLFPVHTAMLEIGAGPDRHGGTNGMESKWKANETKGLDVVAKMQFVGCCPLIERIGEWAFEGMFKVGAAGCRPGVCSEEVLILDEKVFLTTAIGIVANDDPGK